MDQGRRSIFRIGGGGGGSKKNFKIFGALCTQSYSFKVCAPQKLKIVYVYYCFYVQFNGFVVPYDDFLNLFLHYT